MYRYMDIVLCYRDEYSHYTIPRVTETTRTCCSPSNHMVVVSRSHNVDTGEDGTSRGVKKQKYPLDDYLIDTNVQTHTQTSFLSPISPVSSPETADALENAQRLVMSAQKQIMEVSSNSLLNTLDENPSSYMGQQALDESLLYVREMVDSKFQESNDPNRIYNRKVSPNNLENSSRKLQHDPFPVKKSTGMLNKPLEISQQSSGFSTSHMANRIFLENDKPFFKKAPNWFKMKPPQHIDVFPMSTTTNSKSKTQSTSTVPCCTMTNTGVIEISGRDHPIGTIQVQTGPTVDIRGGLTVRTIENVHISPDPSAAPIYNNVATYCFQHEPSTSTSFNDPDRTHRDKYSIDSTGARDSIDARKEKHIQSTDYNDTHKTAHVQETYIAETSLVDHSLSPRHDTNQDIIRKQAAFDNNSNNQSNSNHNNVNSNQIDLSDAENKVSSDSVVTKGSSVRKSSIVNGSLRAQKTLQESVDNGAESAQPKKTVGINLTPMITSAYEEFPVTDAEDGSKYREEDFEGRKSLPKGYYEIPSNLEFASSYGGQKLNHVQSDKDYIQRSRMCGEECRTASCSRKCERDVEHREKQKLKEALEAIANIEKLRYDIRDTGIIPTECTQMCQDKNSCKADAVNFEFEASSEPERFKKALENFCEFNQNNRASKIDTNSKVYQTAIDAFVKMFFDSNTQSDSIHGLYTSDQNLGSTGLAPRGNKQPMESKGPVENSEVETGKKGIAKPAVQVQLISETEADEYHQQPTQVINSKNNNLSTLRNNTARSPIRQFRIDPSNESNKYSAPLARKTSLIPIDKITQPKNVESEKICNLEESSLKNLDLKEPCTSDVDAVLKTYRESIAAICENTEKLSKLISHHIMKNTLSASDEISNVPFNLEKTSASSEKIPPKPDLNLISYGSSKGAGQSVPIHKKNSSNKSFMQTNHSNQIKPQEVTQQKRGQSRISQRDSPSASRDDSESSNDNNSVSTNGTRVSTINEYSSVRSTSPSERGKTFLNTNKKSNPARYNAADNRNHSQSGLKASQQALQGNIRTQPAPKQPKDVKSVRKSDGNKFLNIQYCTTEPFEKPIPLISDKNDSPSQSAGLKTPLSTYLHLENACGKDIGLRRHSNYDIHGEQTAGDFDLYKYPVLISGQEDDFDASDNDCNNELTLPKSAIQTREIELQVFAQILDAVKNSSQFMKRIALALFNGMETESMNDIVRNLEDAAVHPIVIEQFLVILKERNTGKPLFGGNLMLTNPEPMSDDWQKNYNKPTDLPNTRDNMNSFEHSIGFNGSMEIANIHVKKAHEDPAVSHPEGDRRTGSSDLPQRETKLNRESNENCIQSIHDINNPGNEASENKSPSSQIGREVIQENHVAVEESKNGDDNSPMSRRTFADSSGLLEPSLTLPCDVFQIPASEDCQEAKEKLLEIEHYQCSSAMLEGASKNQECSTNSTSDNGTLKKNDSESNTDKDISCLIPYDAEVNNEVVDLSSIQKLTSVTLKNETTGEIIGIQIESNCQNCLRINSHREERGTKINSNPDPEQSSVATDKTGEKLQNFNYPKLENTVLMQNLQKENRSIVCHCQRPKDHSDLNAKSCHQPCESSLDTVNALIDLQIQNSYKQLGLIDADGRPFHHNPNKTAPVTERTSDKRPSPSKSSATSKSPMRRKSNNSSRPGSKKKKSFEKKVIGSKKVLRDNKPGTVKAVQDAEISDPETSDSKNPCPLCIKLQGKCSCPNRTIRITDPKKNPKMRPKSKTQKTKLVKNPISPRRSGSPKDVAFKTPKSKLKSRSGVLSSNSNKKGKPRNDKKLFHDTASDSDNVKVEDKSQNTAKPDSDTACKSTETPNTLVPGEVSVCNSIKTSCRRLTILDQVSRLLPTNPYNIAEMNLIDKPPVREIGTLQCFECGSLMHGSSAHRGRMNVTKETITGCREIRNLPTMGCQTSEICNTFHKNQSNPLETVTEAGTVTVLKTTYPNILDDGSIIVLQPLSELDHTFFIAKPNCVEKKIIQEKLNKRFNCQVRGTTDHVNHVHELIQHDPETNKELTRPNSEIIEQVNYIDRGTSQDSFRSYSTNSVISCVKNKECQAILPDDTEMEDPFSNKQSIVAFAPMHETDSNLSVLENEKECGSSSCTNDEECLRICSQPPLELDHIESRCKQDCPNEEICLTLCSPVSQLAEPSMKTSSININGVLTKFIAENNVPDVKLPIVKGLLKELKKVQDSLRGENEKLGTISEKSESQSDHDSAECLEPRCSAEGSPRSSIKYEEPHEKMKGIMSNRKSLILPNVVREIADMHPSTKLEHLKLRSADPLVSGNFNKSESERRYSVFNQPNPESSTINLNDPRTQEHLAAIAQRAQVKEEKESSSDSSADILTEIIKQPPSVGKSNSNTASKLNKSRRGMDADSNPLVRLNQRSHESDNHSMRSFESSDLEPGEFLQVRTPIDIPIMSCQSRGRNDLEIGEVLNDHAKCKGLCNNDRNHLRLTTNSDSANTQEKTANQYQTLEKKSEFRNKHKRNTDEFVDQSDSVSADRVMSIANESQKIFDRNDSESGVSDNLSILNKPRDLKNSTTNDSRFNNQSTDKSEIEKNSNAENPASISSSIFDTVKSNTLNVMRKHTRAKRSQYSNMNDSYSSKAHEDLGGIINENQSVDYFQKYSDIECSSRPQIIDHFLGKRKLEDLKIEYANNKTDEISKECQSIGGNCQRLYLKSDFTWKTPLDSETSNIMDSQDLSATRNDTIRFNFSSRTRNKTDLANSNQATSKRWDQTSSDTYSEGEINLPSSCSYSLGEVKVSTPSGTTVGNSFKDPDGLTIFVTKSVLDSTYVTCTSPGEILADIQKTETDFSSSISSNINL